MLISQRACSIALTHELSFIHASVSRCPSPYRSVSRLQAVSDELGSFISVFLMKCEQIMFHSHRQSEAYLVVGVVVSRDRPAFTDQVAVVFC
jgi:hypothetical protein